MGTFDVRVQLKAAYTAPTAEFVEVEVPPVTYLAVVGRGDPNTGAEYGPAVEALFAVGYALKFAGKKALGEDMAVGPLEGLWRAADLTAFTSGRKDDWEWTALVPVPDRVDAAALADAVAATAAKGRSGAALDRVHLERLSEGRCVQILHLGPFAAEAPTIARLHSEYLPAHGLVPAGDHHEIYLSDARRTAPERLRTLLRQPVRTA